MNVSDENLLADLTKTSGDFAISPAHGIAAIALQMAMKYHDISTVQDGALYQQYKLEGRNFETLSINMVFETAMQIERHLVCASERVATMVIDAIKDALIEDTEPSEEIDADEYTQPNGESK